LDRKIWRQKVLIARQAKKETLLYFVERAKRANWSLVRDNKFTIIKNWFTALRYLVSFRQAHQLFPYHHN
jgi:hypothetical protein